MKTTIIITSILIISVIIFQSFTMRSTEKTEQQKYSVLEKDDNFEIRYYPKAILATVYSKAQSYKEIASPGFRKLAGYIFGGNEKNTGIAMTAPVHMNINDSISSMSFVMPSNYDIDNLPKPNDSNIEINYSKEEYVASITYGGYSSDNDIKKYSAMLSEILDKKGIKHSANFRFLGYNPPYQFINRKNEIIVSIDYIKN